jgi:hypothetical protein
MPWSSILRIRFPRVKEIRVRPLSSPGCAQTFSDKELILLRGELAGLTALTDLDLEGYTGWTTGCAQWATSLPSLASTCQNVRK